MYSAHAREHAIYSESNHVRVGPGLTCRRTIAGTSINLTGSLRASGALGGSDSSGGDAGGIPDGTVVKWDVIEASPSPGGQPTRKLVQYQATWDAENGVFVKDTDTEPTLVYQLPPPAMSPQWGRVFYDDYAHEYYQYEYTWDAETSTWKQAETKTVIVTLESHASQHG